MPGIVLRYMDPTWKQAGRVPTLLTLKQHESRSTQIDTKSDGLNCVPLKLCPSSNSVTCKCDLLWKQGLCRCDKVKDLNVRSSWI